MIFHPVRLAVQLRDIITVGRVGEEQQALNVFSILIAFSDCAEFCYNRSVTESI